MLRGAISLSIFWKPIDGQRRGLTHFVLKPAGRDGSAVLDSVDTYKCPPEAPKEAVTSTRSVHGHNVTPGTFRGRLDIQSREGRSGRAVRFGTQLVAGDQRQVLSVPLGPSQL